MLRYHLAVTLLFLPYFAGTDAAKAETDYAGLVNPLIGTDSEPAFSNGNTYPAVATPFGMTFWTPRTGDADRVDLPVQGGASPGLPGHAPTKSVDGRLR